MESYGKALQHELAFISDIALGKQHATSNFAFEEFKTHWSILESQFIYTSNQLIFSINKLNLSHLLQ
jgi:hypothetical protein